MLQREYLLNRFIPAPAGNTDRADAEGHRAAVHPRACGEHLVVKGTRMKERGSSPRLRGTPRKVQLLQLPSRFIPAPAGNTLYAPPLPQVDTVHPRACGEHGDTIAALSARAGSSPRLRGTPKGVY